MNRSKKLRITIRHGQELHRRRNGDNPPQNFIGGSGLREAEGVMTSQLRAEIQRWRKEFEIQHPRDEGRAGFVGNSRPYASTIYKEFQEPTVQMGAVNWLHENSGVQIRQISRIIAGETKWTALKYADPLLTAIGSYHKLATGEIRVVPNPGWSNEKYVSYLQNRGCA